MPALQLAPGERWKKKSYFQCGQDVFLFEEDKNWPKSEIPIVIVYNGRSHFCGSWVEDVPQMNMRKMDDCFKSLNHAVDLFNQVVAAGGVQNKNLQRNFGLLMSNTKAVMALMTTPHVPEEPVVLLPTSQESAATPSKGAPTTPSPLPTTTQVSRAGSPIVQDEQPPSKKRKKAPTTFQCDQCEHTPFKKKHEFFDHVKGVHEGNPYRCCDKTFVQKRSYVTHRQESHPTTIASRGYKFQCPECDQGFRTNGRLLDHLFKSHGTGQPYCCIYCKKKISRENEKKHFSTCLLHPDRKSTEGETLLTCHQCGRPFQSKKGLRQHLESGHGGEGASTASRKVCDVCAHTFASQSALERHQQSMHSVTPTQ